MPSTSVRTPTDSMTARPLVPFVAAYCLGILGGYVCSLPVLFPAAFLFVPLAAAAGCFIAGRLRLATGMIALLFFLLGISAATRILNPATSDRFLRERAEDTARVILEGYLTELPERHPGWTRFHFRARHLVEEGTLTPVDSALLLTLRGGAPEFRVGDMLRLKAALYPPRSFGNPGGFDYPRFLSRQGTFLIGRIGDAGDIARIEGRRGNPVRNRIEDLRAEIASRIDSRTFGEAGEVLKALTVGLRRGIPRETREDFSRAGVAHLLAISGLHFGVVAFLFFVVVRFLLSRSAWLLLRVNIFRLSALVSIGPVLFYTLLSGAGIPTLRAATMILTYQAAILLGRERDVLSALLIAAFAILVFSPLSLVEPAFLLSFGSVIAILYLVPRFGEFFGRPSDLLFLEEPSRIRRFSGRVGTFVLVSLAALLGTGPIVAYYFHLVPTASLPANLVLVPFVSFFVLPLGLAACFFHFVIPPAAPFLFDLAAWLTQLAISLTHAISTVPYSWIRVTTPTLLEVALFYLAVPALANLKRVRWARYALAALIATLLLDQGYWALKPRLQRDLRITVLDVGQGDSVLVEFPRGKRMLIDGGGFEGSEFDTGERIVAPFLWKKKIKRIDYLVNTHAHMDHYGGLRFIAREFTVGEFWRDPAPGYQPEFHDFLKEVHSRDIPIRVISDDSPDEEISGVNIEFLNPPRPESEEAKKLKRDYNENSLVMRLIFKDFTYLHTADIMGRAEKRLVKKDYDLRARVLKVPHHGGKTSSTPAFLKRVKPEAAVFTTGRENGYRKTYPEVFKRYEKFNTRIYRSNRHGAVTIRSDGERYTVRTFREPVSVSD